MSVILTGIKYETIRPLSDQAFKRLVGISWTTFHAMMEVLKQKAVTKGRPPKLSVEDQRLMSLSYWREYRTLFHLAMDCGKHKTHTLKAQVVVHYRTGQILSTAYAAGPSMILRYSSNTTRHYPLRLGSSPIRVIKVFRHSIDVP